MIHPVPVILGYRVVCLRGKKQRKKQIGYCVPLKDQLQRLLNLPEVWHFFRNPSMSNDVIHQDINDCKYVKSHRFQEDPTNFLKIALYYDDIEIQNPLRSSQKYKLSKFYFQLLNIPVQFRSKLSSISVLAVCRSKNLQKFGVKNILQDFIETINVLGTSGLSLQINGSKFNVKGALLYVICLFLGGICSPICLI